MRSSFFPSRVSSRKENSNIPYIYQNAAGIGTELGTDSFRMEGKLDGRLATAHQLTGGEGKG